MVKKQLIMEKALELFAEQGFEATSIQQITDRCGISKGAFYLSFKSKDELILALIDHFTHEFLGEIEQAVSSSVPSDQLVYRYLKKSLGYFQKYSNFAHTFMKEYQTTMSEGIFEKMLFYERIFNRITYEIVLRQFPDIKENEALEMVFLIQTFSQRYSHLFLKKMASPIDLDLLCRSIVEKLTILAEHSTIKYFSPDWIDWETEPKEAWSTEELLKSMEEKMELLDEGILKESLQLLYNHLLTPTLSPALISGLLLNLKNDAKTKWISELYRMTRP
ncbi:TetR/AcrR family transcriptional regulator [Chungangia koreensis]|uniref:TetR/AcrR family transcriptional regulator n=1 Tax=Chungangia koreensis TaxID=752657 RepID=A0ABV8X0E2_9LACT